MVCVQNEMDFEMLDLQFFITLNVMTLFLECQLPICVCTLLGPEFFYGFDTYLRIYSL
jgi:hypothetical protein